MKRGATRITRLPTDAGTVTQFAGDETMTVLTSRSLVSDAAIREQVGLSDLDRFETTPSVAVLADETGLDYGRSSIAHEFVAGAELSTFLPSAGLVGLAAPTTNGVKLTSIRTARLTDDGVRPGPLYEAKQDDCDWVGSVAISCGLGGLAGGAAGCATAATIAAIKKAGTPACNPFY